MMNKKVLWITQTAVMLALLICLQWAGSLVTVQPAKQLVTGSFVNCVLAVTVLYVGMSSGVTLALVSPVFAFVLQIAPNFVTVLPIMVGNVCYVVLLRLLMKGAKQKKWLCPVALGAAAAVKFGVLYALVVKVICGAASGALMGKKIGTTVVLAPKMLKMLPGMFGWMQLVTALTGGALALMILPVLGRARRK